jgi:uncharacterized protein YciI
MFFVVYAKDKPGMAETRTKVRPVHRDYVTRLDLPVRRLMGGPICEDDAETMFGTFLFLEGPDRAAVEEFVGNDPYVKAGIFESMEIVAVHKDIGKTAARLR